MSLIIEEISTRNLSCSNPFVSDNWASVKKLNGWSSKAFCISIDDLKFEMLVLIRVIKLGVSIAYIPFAPYSKSDQSSQILSDNLNSISFELKNFLPKSVFVIRFDLPFNYFNKNMFKIDESKFKINKQSIQPDSTIYLNLDQDLELIRSKYRKRAKRYIVKNDKKVKIQKWDGDLESLKLWYAIYCKTAKNDGFVARPFLYIKNVLLQKNCFLLLSFIDDKIVGGIIVFCGVDIAIYLFGCSLRESGYCVSYSLQDEAIQICKNLNIKIYDLFGVGSNKSPHLNSLNIFKSAFGGTIINRPSTFDYIVNPFIYHFFKIIEFARYWIYRK